MPVYLCCTIKRETIHYKREQLNQIKKTAAQNIAQRFIKSIIIAFRFICLLTNHATFSS